jgi:hypothetical protein
VQLQQKRCECLKRKNRHVSGCFYNELVEAAGIEPGTRKRQCPKRKKSSD